MAVVGGRGAGGDAVIQPTFQGEVQFRRYSDTSTQGVQIVLALADRESLEPFISKAGKRFMAVLVEIGDDEMPVQPNTPMGKLPMQGRKDQRGPLCREACDLCAMPEFWQWCGVAYPRLAQVKDPNGARDAMVAITGADSRKEYDECNVMNSRFIELIRIPFMRYMKTRQAA